MCTIAQCALLLRFGSGRQSTVCSWKWRPRLWPRILKIGAPSQNELVKKWTLRSWQPLLTSFAARLMNATNGVGRHADRLQPLNPRCRQFPHCPDRRCQTCLHSGRATDRGIHPAEVIPRNPKAHGLPCDSPVCGVSVVPQSVTGQLEGTVSSRSQSASAQQQ